MKPVSSSTSASQPGLFASIGRKLAELGSAIADGAEVVSEEVVDVVTWSDDAKDKSKKKE